MRIILVFFIITVLWLSGFTQGADEYMTVMIKQKKALNMARTTVELRTLAGNFEQITEAEPDKWHPYYYTAYCYLNMCFLTKINEEKIEYLNKALSFIDRAIEIFPDESELFVLKGFVYMAFIQTDPVVKGKEYADKATEYLQKAIEFNKNNPRAYYLLGLNLLHTPAKYGGGKEAACPYFKKALGLFKSYIPDNVLSPTWGGEENYREYVKNCKD